MTQNSSQANPISPELRATAYSFSFFATSGAAVAYSGIWFAEHGLSNAQIGIVNSAPVFALLLINIFVGRLADRASDWRSVIIFGSWAAALFSLGLFFTQSYWPILAVWTLVNLAYGAIGPVADAGNTRLTARRGTSYGAIRAWGTIGYVAAVFATGPLVSKFGGGIFIGLYVALAFLRALVALALPRFRHEAKAEAAAGSAGHLSEMFQPWLLLPILAWAMVQSTNMALMSFQAKFFNEQGLSGNLISLLIGIGAIAEVIVLFLQPWLKRNFTPHSLIIIAGLAAILRWTCLAFTPGLFWLVPLQMLNAITYGVGFIGLIGFITRWTSEEIAAEAMSFYAVIQQIATILMITGFGYIAAVYGAGAFFASAAMSALAIAILIYTLWAAPPPTTAPDRSVQHRSPA